MESNDKEVFLRSASATCSAAEVQRLEVEPHEHTNSVNRSYSDINGAWFIFYSMLLCWVRTAAQQPLNLALARQQTVPSDSGRSTWRIILSVYSSEGGWHGLSQGFVALTLGCALSEAIYLWVFEYGREVIPLACTVTRDLIAGYVADALCRLVHLPLSIVALRQMTAGTIGKSRAGTTGAHVRGGIVRTLVTLYRERGLRSVYAGYGMTLVFGCQWTAVWWAMYGSSKSYLYAAADVYLISEREAVEENKMISTGETKINRRWSSWTQWVFAKDDNVLLNTAASILTSASTACIFNPYLVVRSNLQVTPNARLLSVTRHIYRTRGLRGFYNGLGLSIGTCLIDGVLASTSYECAKLWSEQRYSRRD